MFTVIINNSRGVNYDRSSVTIDATIWSVTRGVIYDHNIVDSKATLTFCINTWQIVAAHWKERQYQFLPSFQKPEHSSCDEKNGWYNAGLDAKLREILTKEIKKVILEEARLAELDDDDFEK